MPGSYYKEEQPTDADALLDDEEEKAATLTRSRRERLVRRLHIVVVAIMYALVGPTLVLANNRILRKLHFPYPLLLSTLGLVTTGSVCALILHLGPHLRRRIRRRPAATAPSERHEAGGLTAEGEESPRIGPTGTAGAKELEAEEEAARAAVVTPAFWLRNMVPIGAAQGLTFAATNAAYMYLTITFTQMLAAFTPTVTLVMLYVSGVESPTTYGSVCVLLISFGCALSSYGEGHFDLVGVAFRSVGILSEATRLVLTQKLLTHHKLDVVRSQYYLAPAGASFLLLGAAFTEVRRFRDDGAIQTVLEHPLLFSASALLGVAASMLTLTFIKLTGSVTLKAMNTARNAAFVLFTVTFLHEEASALQLCGYLVSLLSFSLYTYFKVIKLA